MHSLALTVEISERELIVLAISRALATVPGLGLILWRLRGVIVVKEGYTLRLQYLLDYMLLS